MLKDSEIRYRRIEATLVAYKRIHGTIRDLPDVIETLTEAAGALVCGVPIVVHHWPLQDESGRDMDVCIPINKELERADFNTMTLRGVQAATIIHTGSYDKIGESYQKIIANVYSHGLPIAENGRETYPNLDLEIPENNRIEIQVVLHNWETRFSENLIKVLGIDAEESVMKSLREIPLTATTSERTRAIITAIHKLESIADDTQSFEVLSRCAHVFPPELISAMREFYLETESVDEVISTMKRLGGFYPSCRREGNILYSRKKPANPKAYEEATTREEKRKAYCFCPLIKESLDEVPETFCNCSAGWPRQVWEGILKENVRVKVVKSLTAGDDYCEFAIFLPESVSS